MERLYTVSVFDKINFLDKITQERWMEMRIIELETFWKNHFGDIWTCGTFLSEEDAINVIENNTTDIQESCYKYAIMEEYQLGLYPHLIKAKLFIWNKENKKFEPYNHDFLSAGFQGFTFSR